MTSSDKEASEPLTSVPITEPPEEEMMTDDYDVIIVGSVPAEALSHTGSLPRESAC